MKIMSHIAMVTVLNLIKISATKLRFRKVSKSSCSFFWVFACVFGTITWKKGPINALLINSVIWMKKQTRKAATVLTVTSAVSEAPKHDS